MLTGKYEYLDEAVINFINKTIKTREDFDEARFQLWIDNNEIQSKSNPSAFVNKCFLKELNKGTFAKVEEPELHYVPGCQPIYNELRDAGILVPDSTAVIYRINEWLLNHQILSVEELRELNHKVVDYLKAHKDTLNSDAYITVVKKSKMLSGKKVDWKEIERLSKEDIEDWHRMLDELKQMDEQSED